MPYQQKYTLAQQLQAVKRELAVRRNVYPKWVSSGKMKQKDADEGIEVFEDLIHTLENCVLPMGQSSLDGLGGTI